MDTSPRPETRPKTVLPYDDIEKIERVVWDEARGEGVEGRNAVRSVIFNRLMSDRFPDTIDEILVEDEFEGVGKYGGVTNIPAPEEDLQAQINEFVDYVQLGEDVTDGRTFFQNAKTTKSRGTGFKGPDPIVIGNHTFTRGYEGQEPVHDTAFSHNIEIVYPEYAGFSLGGLAEARKGILTEAGKDMAKNKFQLDNKEADLDGDGKLSKYEETRGEAVQQAMAVDDPTADEKYDGLNCGGMMEPEMGYDPVSGNPIPPGSTAENVRDDIPAWLSEGEYVLPADVVKWHGLKHIMNMQDEAKAGLMMMTDMGLIVETEMEDEEETSEEEVEVEETPEGNEIEFPEVEMTEEIVEGEETEELAEDEMYGKEEEEMPSMFGMVKKPKVTFII
jgi:hypothetical protein